MKISFLCLSNVAVAFAAALYAEGATNNLDRRDLQIQAMNTVGGARLVNSNLNTVTGTWVIPKLEVPPGGAGRSYWFSSWIGLESSTNNPMLQAGVFVQLDPTGVYTYHPWVEWYPETNTYYDTFSVTADDTIRVTITVGADGYSATVFFENLTTFVTQSVPTGGTPQLLGTNAMWMVENFIGRGGDWPSFDSNTLEFTNCTSGIPGSPAKYPMTLNGQAIFQQVANIATTDCVQDSTVTITFGGSNVAT